jgi:dethiobiotin synthase
MAAYFITATGTGTGKTFVTAGLLRFLREAGRKAQGFKPVLSGYDVPAGSDAAHLLEAMGKEASPDDVAAIAPFRFRAPLSPDMAAALEGRRLDFSALTRFCHDAAAQSGPVLIEGVGGVMVPLDESRTVLDLMAALGLPVVLVAGSFLGSISYTLTAAAVLRSAGIKIAALVVNDSGPDEGAGNIPLGDTVASLKRFLPDIALFALPRNPTTRDFAPLAAALWGGETGGG